MKNAEACVKARERSLNLRSGSSNTISVEMLSKSENLA